MAPKAQAHTSVNGFQGSKLLAPQKGFQDLFPLGHSAAPIVMIRPQRINPMTVPMMMPSSSGCALFMFLKFLHEGRRGVLDYPLGELAYPVVTKPGLRTESRPLSPQGVNVLSSFFGHAHGCFIAASYHLVNSRDAEGRTLLYRRTHVHARIRR